MKYLLVALTALLIGCDVESQEEMDFRVDSLYEHTIQMQYFADEELLEKLGLNLTPFENTSRSLSRDQKLQIIAESYGTDNTDIDYLETRMIEMMNLWQELTS